MSDDLKSQQSRSDYLKKVIKHKLRSVSH